MNNTNIDSNTLRTFKPVLFATILAAIFISGCGSVKDSLLLISQGDSKEQVIKVMGAPEDRQFKDKSEAWQYGSIAAIGICEYTVVWFENGTVTGLNSYRNSSVMGCRVGLKSIKWEDAPNKVIEFRDR